MDPREESRRENVVFVVGGLDGTTTYFRHVAMSFDERVRRVALEAPGVYGECEPFSTVEALARHHADRVVETAVTGATLVGWSFGSAVAFHAAWLLDGMLDVAVIALDPLWAVRARRLPPGRATSAAACGWPERTVSAASRRALQTYAPRVSSARTLYLVAEAHGALDPSVFAHMHDAPGRYSIERVPGDHHSMLVGRGAACIAAAAKRFSTTSFSLGSHR